MRKYQKYRDLFRSNLQVEMAIAQYTIRDLALDSGVSVSALVSYRNASRDVPLVKVYVLAKTLGCSVHDLVPEA
jgi:hypothetical protein